MTPAAEAYEVASAADIGGREEQQDRVAVLERNGSLLLVVADGMGGHDGGALAAQAVVDAAEKQFGGVHAGQASELLNSIVERAHERINAIGDERGIAPHSTCVLLHLTSAAASWAHVGDSRLYRFSGALLVDRTIDHSMAELMRLQGKIAEEEMKAHPDRNRLYEALGGARPPEIAAGQARLTGGEGFLLASDGLWENVTDAELAAMFKASHLKEYLGRLIHRARKRGGRNCDNISAAVARAAGFRGPNVMIKTLKYLL